MGARTHVLNPPFQSRRPSRTAPRAVRLAALLLGLAAAPLTAQDPVPADTVAAPPDTVQVPIPPEQVAQDTLPAGEPTDTVRPAPALPRFPRAPAQGFAEARWEWDREALGRWHGTSLLELLEQVPGLLVTRAGWYGRPAGLAAFGLGGGRVRVFLDGFELDPLTSATFDLQHLAVVDLEAVAVERGLAETRVEIQTFALQDTRPFSQIEAGTGLFNTRILRGLFATTTGGRSVLTVGLDVTDTDGWLRAQPFSQNTGVARWSYAFATRSALQVEYRQSGIELRGNDFAFDGDRRDLVFRLRSLLLPGLALDATAGRSSRRPGGDTDTIGMELSSLQGALRARYDFGSAWLGAGARLRNDDRVAFAQPTLDLSAELGLRPAPWLGALGGVRHTRVGEVSGAELEGSLRLGPVAGLSIFAGAATGTRGVGIARDTLVLELGPPAEGDTVPVERLVSRLAFPAIAATTRAFRAGAEWSGFGIRAGGAYVRHDVDSIAAFGVGFDRTAAPVEALPVDGFEGYASVPLVYRPLRLEGAYSYWRLDTPAEPPIGIDAISIPWLMVGGRPYQPQEHGRVALVFSERFYEGNLEPTLRLEATYRGASRVPTPDGAGFNDLSSPYTLFNIFLQIRVLDVRAFLLWENVLNNVLVADLPGRTYGGQRAIYGIRWHFLD